MRNISRAAVVAALLAPAALIGAGSASATNGGDPCPGNHIPVYNQGDNINHHYICSTVKGEKGDTGPQGPKGDDGVSDVPGPKGDTGDEGPAGPKGDDGEASTVPGPKGDQGEAGAPGSDGADGVDGLPGAPGLDGADGVDGIDGLPGINGVDGSPGLNGADGVSPTIAQIETGLDECAGDGGVMITQGETTLLVCNGVKGEDGEGFPGETGPAGPQGEPGTATSGTGARGPAGKDGISKTIVVEADGTVTEVGNLPNTGSDSDTALWLGAIGGALLVSGGVAMFAVRKRRGI